MITAALLVASFGTVATGIVVGSYKHPKYDKLGYTLTLAGAFLWTSTGNCHRDGGLKAEDFSGEDTSNYSYYPWITFRFFYKVFQKQKELFVTIKTARQLGYNMRRRKRTLFYTIEGNEQQALVGLLGELLAISKAGDLTLRELVVLAAYGAAFKRTEKDMVEK